MRTGTDTLIEIRPLLLTDREPLRRILEETGVFTGPEVGVALELIDTVLEDPHNPDYTIATGEGDGGRIVGYYCIGRTPMTESTWDLYWIAVDPATHHQGVGRQLLRHAEEFIAHRGGTLVVAETSSQPKYEPTRRFYLRNAYVEVSRIRDYYRAGDDLVVYGKYLSS